jgi:signal transduction histidine kinase
LPDVKFLIVDDLEENLFAFERSLHRDGLQLITARSGPAALEALLVHDFSLAIIDVEMPTMDGVELAELMRGTERTRHVPIIFVTAGSREHQRLFRGYEAGAVDFLYKPIEPVVLRNKAETFFELSRQKQQLGRQLDLLREQQRRMQPLLDEVAQQASQLRRQNEDLVLANQTLQNQAHLLEQSNDELAAAQLDCRRAQEVAEATNRAKDEFLANVSHEIRTPMNAIVGMTELVLDTPLSEGQRQSLQTVRSAAGNLLGTINDLLDFSKIEAGKLELDPTSFSLRAAVGETLRALAMRAHRKGLELICDVHPSVPDAIVGDVGRLGQVLLNLVGNAIKFTETGEIVVEIRVTPGAFDGDEHLGFSVRDTGIGIAPDKQDRIFHAFEQEDMSTTRKYGGTGLGLTISARLIELMGGNISVRSDAGRGSTFTFTARFDRQPGGKERPASSSALHRGLRVFVVGDNATHRRILDSWLREWEMEPISTSANGAAVAGELEKARAAGRPFELALLDARSPDADDPSFAATIRGATELSTTRIVLLTSGERAGEADQYRQLRINARLLKPVLQHELFETIHRVMRLSPNEIVTGTVAPAVPVDRGVRAEGVTALRVLVAEDNEFNSQLLELLLVGRGHHVRLAKTGRETLRLVEADPYDLLLLDVHMPELDGFGVIHAIREREQDTGGRLPVVAVTARSRKEDRQRCLEAGMDDFLLKPINAMDLWAAIDRVGSRA